MERDTFFRQTSQPANTGRPAATAKNSALRSKLDVITPNFWKNMSGRAKGAILGGGLALWSVGSYQIFPEQVNDIIPRTPTQLLANVITFVDVIADSDDHSGKATDAAISVSPPTELPSTTTIGEVSNTLSPIQTLPLPGATQVTALPNIVTVPQTAAETVPGLTYYGSIGCSGTVVVVVGNRDNGEPEYPLNAMARASGERMDELQSDIAQALFNATNTQLNGGTLPSAMEVGFSFTGPDNCVIPDDLLIQG